MSVARWITEQTGKLPFSGRHAVRRNFYDGLRAARAQDRERVGFYAQNIGSMAVANSIFASGAAVLAAVEAKYGIEHGSIAAAGEAVYNGMAALAYGASAFSQTVVRGRLQELGAAIPEDTIPRPITPASHEPDPVTLTERAVTTGSKFGMAATIGHMLVRVL